MQITNNRELAGIKKAGEAVAITLKKMKEYAAPGMSTKELDEYGNSILRSFGAISAPKKDYNFPGYTCICLNKEACHGIPSSTRLLKEGDLINIDVSASLNGFYGDNGQSFVVGKDHHNFQAQIDASIEILYLALKQIKARTKIAHVGGVIEKEAKLRGYNVIKNLFGHGVGRKLHELPREVPNFKDKKNNDRFRKNSVVAIETFISTKAQYVQEAADGWTMMARDNSYVVQHEHTIIVTDNYPIILTKDNGI